MDWQLLLVIVLVLLSLAYLVRRTLRSWRGKGAGCGGCKCPGTLTIPNSTPRRNLIPLEQVRLRQR
jgi:hypothetical protein